MKHLYWPLIILVFGFGLEGSHAQAGATDDRIQGESWTDSVTFVTGTLAEYLHHDGAFRFMTLEAIESSRENPDIESRMRAEQIAGLRQQLDTLLENPPAGGDEPENVLIAEYSRLASLFRQQFDGAITMPMIAEPDPHRSLPFAREDMSAVLPVLITAARIGQLGNEGFDDHRNEHPLESLVEDISGWRDAVELRILEMELSVYAPNIASISEAAESLRMTASDIEASVDRAQTFIMDAESYWSEFLAERGTEAEYSEPSRNVFESFRMLTTAVDAIPSELRYVADLELSDNSVSEMEREISIARIRLDDSEQRVVWASFQVSTSYLAMEELFDEE